MLLLSLCRRSKIELESPEDIFISFSIPFCFLLTTPTPLEIPAPPISVALPLIHFSVLVDVAAILDISILRRSQIETL